MFNNYSFHQKKLTKDEMDSKYNISYDNQNNKVFKNVDNFLQYLRHLCNDHCNNQEDLYSIDEFRTFIKLQYISREYAVGCRIITTTPRVY